MFLGYSEDAFVDIGHESNPLTNKNCRSSEKGITIARAEASIVGTRIEGVMILRNILPVPRVIDQNELTRIEPARREEENENAAGGGSEPVLDHGRWPWNRSRASITIPSNAPGKCDVLPAECVFHEDEAVAPSYDPRQAIARRFDRVNKKRDFRAGINPCGI